MSLWLFSILHAHEPVGYGTGPNRFPNRCTPRYRPGTTGSHSLVNIEGTASGPLTFQLPHSVSQARLIEELEACVKQVPRHENWDGCTRFTVTRDPLGVVPTHVASDGACRLRWSPLDFELDEELEPDPTKRFVAYVAQLGITLGRGPIPPAGAGETLREVIEAAQRDGFSAAYEFTADSHQRWTLNFRPAASPHPPQPRVTVSPLTPEQAARVRERMKPSDSSGPDEEACSKLFEGVGPLPQDADPGLFAPCPLPEP